MFFTHISQLTLTSILEESQDYFQFIDEETRLRDMPLAMAQVITVKFNQELIKRSTYRFKAVERGVEGSLP